MKTTRKVLVGSAIAASAFLSAGSVGAALITQTYSFGADDAPISFAAPMATPTFNLFDSSLGSLTSITIEFDATITGETTLRKNSGNAAVTPSGNVTRTLTLDLSSISGLSNLVISDIDPWTTTLPQGGVGNTAQTQSVTPVLRNTMTNSMDAEILALFTGQGSVSFALNGLFTDDLIGSGFNLWASTSSASGGVTLKYNYSATQEPPPVSVPEPGTLALLGLGLFGLGAMRRRMS